VNLATDIFLSIIKLGLPVSVLSWIVFFQIYNRGDIDRTADRKAINSHIKALRATYKSKKKHKINIVQDKWMRFGGGFYGLAALWTFLIIELTDAFNFIFHNPGTDALFGDGAASLLFEALSNQLENFISAFVWFSYWNVDSIVVLVLTAYAGYWLGIEVARRQSLTPVVPWIDKIRLLLKIYRP